MSAARIYMSLDRSPSVVRDARDTLARLLEERASVSFVRDALLLTSELVTNAVVHGNGSCELRASFTCPPEHLRVDVIDESPDLPVPTTEALRRARLGGLGLLLVADVASHWGVDHIAGGAKSVWFELGS